jgi:ribosome-binding factor A
MAHRDKRVADAIRDSVAGVILNRLSDPAIGFVTVTRCRVSRDLRNATVFVSVMGSEGQRRTSLEHLERARGHIRRLVGTEVQLRYLPNLYFELDEVLAHEQHVGELIDGLKPNQDPAPPSPES